MGLGSAVFVASCLCAFLSFLLGIADVAAHVASHVAAFVYSSVAVVAGVAVGVANIIFVWCWRCR